MEVSLAQIRVKSGDIEGNLSRILGALDEVPLSSDVVLFPEMCISGYNCGCLFEYEQFINDCLEAVDKISKAARQDLIVVVGGPRFAENAKDDAGNIRLHNSAFVIQNGKLLHVYDKRSLANDYHHEDRKYFLPGTNLPIVPGLPLGILICEDIWHKEICENFFITASVAQLNGQPRVKDLLVLNFSYYCAGKQPKRHQLARGIATQGIKVHYCNAVGVGDISKNLLIYDGASFSVDCDGTVIEAPSYTSGVYSQGNMWPPTACTWEQETWSAMTVAVKWCFEEFGLKKAQVHLSGGVDSSIVAALAVQALGKENVVFITNPGEHTSQTTLDLANRVANALDVPLRSVSVAGLESVLNTTLEVNGKIAAIVKSTISAVGRTVVGLALTNEQFAAGVPTGILATGNHTENILGWCNFHDIGSIGVMQPIGDLTKTELFQLCAWINHGSDHEIIPEELLNGKVKPMAELADTDVDPFDYYLYSGICAEMLRDRATPQQLLVQFDSKTLDPQSFPGDKIYKYGRSVFAAACDDAMRRAQRSVYKGAQHAPVLVLNQRTRGFSARETLINHYKWSGAAKPTPRLSVNAL